jgi:hypothetical protein
MVLSFTFFPLMLPYTLGNIQTWINSGLVASLLLFIHGGRFSVGVVIGLCCTIKPSWSLIVLWFLLRREYQAVLGMFVVGFGLASVSLVMFGLSVHLEYLQLLRFLSSRGESYFSNQSLNGLLNRMFFLGNNLEWDGSHTLLKYDAWVHGASSITSLLLIGACVIPWRQGDRRGTTAGFCIALMTFLLASPVAYRHYYAMMLPIMWITLIAISYRRPQLRWLQLLLAVAYIASANTISGVDYLAPTMFNVLQSYLYFAGLLVLGLLYYLFPAFSERADGDCPLRC